MAFNGSRNRYVLIQLQTKFNRLENFDWRIVRCKSSFIRLVSWFRKVQATLILDL